MLQLALVRLVPLGDEHLEHDVELDPEVMRHLSPTGRTHEEVEQRHAARLAEATPGPGRVWVGLVDERRSVVVPDARRRASHGLPPA